MSTRRERNRSRRISSLTGELGRARILSVLPLELRLSTLPDKSGRPGHNGLFLTLCACWSGRRQSCRYSPERPPRNRRTARERSLDLSLCPPFQTSLELLSLDTSWVRSLVRARVRSRF